MAAITVTEANDGGVITAAAGDTVVVQLPETPTTGFRWQLAEAGSNILTSAGDYFELAAQTGVGGGGVRTWRFTVARPGTAELEFKLARSWEAGAARSAFRVRVKAS
jgi:predicted secreted protein